MRRLPTLLLTAGGLAAALALTAAAQTRQQALSERQTNAAANDAAKDNLAEPRAPRLPTVRHGTPEANVIAPLSKPPPPAATPPAVKPAQTTTMRPTMLHHGDLKLAPDPNAFKRPKRDSRLKSGELVRGTTSIAAAWFSGATTRYRFSPFGDNQHPTVVTVSTKEHRVLRFELPKDSVFEDRTPRLIDLDGDGTEEIVVVRTYERKGAALAVLGIRGAAIEIIAETPAIGTPSRWLNPIGFGDFDGDGRLDIALVATPHAEGELQIWALRGGAFEKLAETDDVSNHAPGSRHQKLSVIADFDGDGIADIAVPSQDRRRLRFLTLTKGEIRELGEVRLPTAAAEDFELVTVSGKPAVRVGHASGRVTIVSPCRDISDWDGAC